MSQPLSESDIIFPHLSNTPNLSSTLTSLKRSTLSIHNRLNSITFDSQFVDSVSGAYSLPLIANERCGSWYIPPKKKIGSVYFKSTDGHMGQWGFSLRRLNLQLLDVVEQYGGAVIVDSTRRGKSMPDALSKTVPIWCCVINRAVFGGNGKHELFTPPQAVGQSEHAQMESKIDGFAKQFLEICKPNLALLRSKLQKPLRPIWVTQKSTLPEEAPSFPEFHPIVLCTASRRVQGAEASEGGYIQGAADDHEAWSHGLTPPVFWKNKDLLMASSEEDAPSLVAQFLTEETNTGPATLATLIKPTSNIHITSSQNVDLTGFDVVISCTPDSLPATTLESIKLRHYLDLKCQSGKLGSRDLRNELTKLVPFLANVATPSPKILMCCPTGKDLSVGTALAILCLHVDASGMLDIHTTRSATEIDKTLIKQRLSWITTSNPALNPSRATLQSVNAVLLTSQDPKKTIQQNLPIRPKPADTQTTTSASEPPPREPQPDKQETTKETYPSTIFATLSKHKWSFHRTLTSTLPTHPSGTVTGNATFSPCTLPASFPATLLYAEEGDFATDSGLKFRAKRKYVYQLGQSIDSDAAANVTAAGDGEVGKEEVKTIIVRFFDDEKIKRGEEGLGQRGEAVGGLFVEMDTLQTSTSTSTLTSTSDSAPSAPASSEPIILEATNKDQHLCAEDLYSASWKFGAGMVGGGEEGRDMWWEVRYDVKGPKKDYVSVTRYEIGK